MSRKPAAFSVQAQHFNWRLFRREGVYYADGRNPTEDLGKHSLGTRNRTTALQRLTLLDRKKAVALGKAREETPASNIALLTIEKGWEDYLAFAARPQVMKGASPSTLKRYKAVRDHHVEFCRKSGVLFWTEFNKAQLEKYAKQRGSKQAYRTVYLELTTLKSVSKWLVQEKLIPADCRLHYALSKPQGTDAYCYRPEEVASMVEHCRAQADLTWLGNLIVLLAHTGLRISEAAELRWTDVDFAAGVIRVQDERSSALKRKTGLARTTKGRRSRAIPLHPQLREHLQSLKRYPDGRVLHARRGGKLLPRVVLAAFIEELIEPLAKNYPTPEGEVGFECGRLHSFRHYFCSQAFIWGATEGEVREWLGHADSKMVEHYRHLRSEDALRRMQRITFLPTEAKRPSDDAVNQSAPEASGTQSASKQLVGSSDVVQEDD